ncbi:hypothetical protein LAZ29_12230 [Cereibacter sphaeroides]|uniref:hypothetical protein n=1 Tax=Cereibacter sphaeroides TaxID=1063 RepID=UPI001F19E02F|nr:hypothetical protein [Cereibacter sphaeroides]MCE6951695.1 hypothetical protein [Cereibacter sphaeroides]
MTEIDPTEAAHLIAERFQHEAKKMLACGWPPASIVAGLHAVAVSGMAELIGAEATATRCEALALQLRALVPIDPATRALAEARAAGQA